MNTHKQTLRELSKFASGLVAGDFLFGLWIYFSHLLPITFLGIVCTPQTVVAWMIFDAALFIILVHYGWHANIHEPTLREKNLFIIVGIVTGIIALVHFFRLIFGTSVVIGSWTAPIWLSAIGAAGAAFISYSSFRFAEKKRG